MFDNTMSRRLRIICVFVSVITLISHAKIGLAQVDTLELPLLFQQTAPSDSIAKTPPRITFQPPPGQYSSSSDWRVEISPSKRDSSRLKMLVHVPANIDEIEIVPVHQLEMSSIARVMIEYSDAPSVKSGQAKHQAATHLASVGSSDRIATEKVSPAPPSDFEGTISESDSSVKNRTVKNPFFDTLSASPIRHFSTSSFDQPVRSTPRKSPARGLPSKHQNSLELEMLPVDGRENSLNLRGEDPRIDNSGVRVMFSDSEDISDSSPKQKIQHVRFDSAISPANFVTPSHMQIPTSGIAPIEINLSDERGENR